MQKHQHALSQQDEEGAREQVAEERLQAILDSMLDAFVTLRAIEGDGGEIVDFCITSANEEYARRLGRTSEDITGRTLNEVCPCFEEKEFFEFYRRVQQSGEPIVRTFHNTCEKLQGEWFEEKVARVATGEVAVTLSDITEQHASRIALQEAAEFKRQLIQTIPVPVYFKDEELRYRLCNRAFEELTGASSKEILGKTVHDVWKKSDADTFHKSDMDLVHSDPGIQVYESFFTNKRSELKEILFHKACFQKADGSLGGIIGVVEDVTERNRFEAALHRSRKEFEDLVFAMNQLNIVAITDTRGSITNVNDNFCKISKYSREELIGKNHRIINSGHHPLSFWENLWKTIASGKVWKGEILNRAKDGTLYWVETSITPFLDDEGKPFQYIAIRADITERKDAEAQLIRAKEVAEAASRAKSDFLSVMSHELRTPLNPIIGFSEVLKETSLTAEQNKYVDFIGKSAEHLFSLISEILDLSRIEAGLRQPEITTISLREFLPKTLDPYRLKAAEKHLKIHLLLNEQCPQSIQTDSSMLRQILGGLVSNAVKFTDKGDVTIRVDCDGIASNGYVKLYFEVTDTGIGIPQNKLDTIFELFTQIDTSPSRKFNGLGLGLKISHQLVEILGGEIEAESKEGEGSSFRFWINARCPNTTKYLDESLSPKIVRRDLNLKVLLVEDVRTNQAMGVALLQFFGSEIDVANNGLEAVQMAKSKPFDVILMDIRMPVMDGLEATRKIREAIPHEHLPYIVATTANAMKEDRETYLARGMDDYLPKPITRLLLYSILLRAEAFKRKRAEAQETLSSP